MEKKFSCRDYLENKCTHREFYGQYVNPRIKELVEDVVGIKRILKSEDSYFNDIYLINYNISMKSETTSGDDK